MKQKFSNIQLLVQLLLLLIEFGYIVYRANNLSFTHDEAFTYKFLIFEQNPSNTANHHILNTELMRHCKSWLGISELSLRLPNVLAFLFYALGYFLITRRSGKIKHSWLLFSLYFFNPFVLDFFSLARGYGLSLGFISVSLYGFLKVSETHSVSQNLKYLAICLFFGTLSILSNLAVINYFMIVWGFLLIRFFILFKQNPSYHIKNAKLKITGVFLLFLIPIIIGINRLLWLKSRDQLYYGADEFFHTISSFVSDTLYAVTYPGFVYSSIRISILVFISIGLLMVLFHIKKLFKLDVIILFLGLILTLIIENWLFQAKFPMGRTVLFMYPLFLFFVARYVELFPQVLIRKALKAIGVVLSFFVIVHCWNAKNFAFTANWKYDANTKDVMNFIKQKEVNGEAATLSNDWLMEPAVNYYRDLLNLKLAPSSRDGINLKTDYIFTLERTEEYKHYTVVSEYPVSKTILLKKNW